MLADNDPIFKEVNTIIAALGHGFSLEGNYYGCKNITASNNKKSPGYFDIDHPVAKGFSTLYEGHSISYPNRILDNFQVFAYNTNAAALQPTIIYQNRSVNNGTLWIDTAFTKLGQMSP